MCHFFKLQERLFGIPFTLNNIYADKASAIYYVHLNAGSKTDDPKSRIVFDLTLEVIADSKVKLIGSVTSPKDEVQVGSLFHQDYRVGKYLKNAEFSLLHEPRN